MRLSPLTGTGQQLRLFIRLNRLGLLLWPLIFAGLLAAMADSLASLYPDATKRREYAALNDASPVLKAINGPGHGLDSPGGILIFEVGGYLLLIGAIVAAIIMVRHTRGEEESGRGELTGSAREGRLAPLAATYLGVLLLGLITGAASAVAMVGSDLPIRGALVYGAGVVAVFGVFGAVGSITAQLTVRASVAVGMAGVAVALGYALRAVGDIDDNGMSWASPFGWVQAARPFASERIWPILLAAGIGLVLVGLAGVLRLRRDEGAGLLAARPGRAEAAQWLTGVTAARVRQIRGPLLGWGTVAVVLAAIFGAAGDEVIRVFEAGSGFAEMLGLDEAGARDAYFTMVILLHALIVLAFGLSVLGRLRGDETSGLAELELATSTSRTRWLLSAVGTVLIATGLVAGSAGLALATSFSLVSGDSIQFDNLALAMVFQLPPIWVVLGVSALLFGWFPRLQPLGWVLLGLCGILGLLGGPLQLDQAVIDFSPFAHAPTLPNPSVGVETMVMIVATMALTTGSVLGVRHRDI